TSAGCVRPSFSTRRSSDLVEQQPLVVGAEDCVLLEQLGSGLQQGQVVLDAGVVFVIVAGVEHEGLIEFLGAERGQRARLLDPKRSEEHTSELQSREKLVCR